MSEIVRIEKIDVNVIDGSKEHKLVMNKFVSTPLNCAMRKLTQKVAVILRF